MKHHHTILTKGKIDSLKSAVKQCPFCKYTNCLAPMLQIHIQRHVDMAVTYKDYIIVKCNDQCRTNAHFHCCFCEKTIIQRSQLKIHISSHNDGVRTDSKINKSDIKTVHINNDYTVKDPPSCQKENKEGFSETFFASEGSNSPTWTSTPESSGHAPLHILNRKRKRHDIDTVLEEMQAANERNQMWLERMEERFERRFEMMMKDAREERQHRADIARQQIEQTNSFNQSFLNILNQLVQVLSSRIDPVTSSSQ